MTDIVARLDGWVVDAWGQVVSATGGETLDGEWFRLCVLPPLGSVLLFWAFNIPLLIFNFCPSINPFERYKVQKDRHETADRVAWMVALVLFNHALGMAIAVSSWNFQSLKQQGIQAGMQGIPSFIDLAWKIPACCMLYDLIFFCIHCVFHTKWLYHNIHKVHHRSKITIGISSAYFHPVDYIVSGISVLAPPLIVSSHAMVSLIWMLVHMCETTNAHCGYDLSEIIPLIPSAKDHDFHHSHSFYSSKKYRFVTMGAFGLVWDRLFGTHKPVHDWWAANPNGIQRGKDAPVEAEFNTLQEGRREDAKGQKWE